MCTSDQLDVVHERKELGIAQSCIREQLEFEYGNLLKTHWERDDVALPKACERKLIIITPFHKNLCLD